MSGPFRKTDSNRRWRRDVVRIGGVILLCLAVAGCSLFEGLGSDATVAADSGAISEFPLSALPDLDVPDAVPQSTLTAAVPKPKPHVMLPAESRPVMPNLLGSSEAEVLTALGVPHNRDDRHPAHMWRYVVADCALNLLFFYDVTNDHYRLAMVMGDDGAVESAEAIACLLPPAAKKALS